MTLNPMHAAGLSNQGQNLGLRFRACVVAGRRKIDTAGTEGIILGVASKALQLHEIGKGCRPL